MNKVKTFGTLAESTRLFSSVAIIIIFASTLTPEIFVLFTLCISSANLVASISNLGIPIWINIKFDQFNLLRARQAIFFSTVFFLPSLVVFSHFTFLKNVSISWSLLLITEFLLAGPIAFENRVLLSELKNRKYLYATLLQTICRVVLLITIAFFGKSSLFILYLIFALIVYSRNHIRNILFSSISPRLIIQTYVNSLSVGSIGMLANFLDSLPIIWAGLSLKPIEAATAQLVLRTASVALIPSNALASVSMAEKAKSKDFSYIKSHLLFSIFSSLAVIISIFLILKYFLFFDNYPNLVNFLWFQLIFVTIRSLHITIGNYLTFKNQNRLRLISLGTSCFFLLLILFFIKINLNPETVNDLLLGYLCSEILACLLICFYAKKLKK